MSREPIVSIRWKRLGVIALVLCILPLALQIPVLNVWLNTACCRLWYQRNAGVLAGELPSMQQCADGENYPMYAAERSAFIRQTDSGACIDVKLSDYGDLYRHTYRFGVAWATDADALFAANPDADFSPLGDGWFLYSLVQSQ